MSPPLSNSLKRDQVSSNHASNYFGNKVSNLISSSVDYSVIRSPLSLEEENSCKLGQVIRKLLVTFVLPVKTL